MRISAAHVPAVKTVKKFACSQIPATTRDVLAHLATPALGTKRRM